MSDESTAREMRRMARALELDRGDDPEMAEAARLLVERASRLEAAKDLQDRDSVLIQRLRFQLEDTRKVLKDAREEARGLEAELEQAVSTEMVVEIETEGRPKLTKKQEKVLRFIQQHRREYQMAPTLREIAAHIGICSTNGVSDHLRALERKGYIKRRDGALSRGIMVITKAA